MTDPAPESDLIKTGVVQRVSGLSLSMAEDPKEVLYSVYDRMLRQLKMEWMQRDYTPMEDIEVELRISCIVTTREAEERKKHA